MIFCGHSLGGALGVLAALDAKPALPRGVDLSVYSFGSPRLANQRFARSLNRVLPSHYRFVYERDMIPQYPKFLYVYKHAGTEVMVDGSANLIFGPSSMERTFMRFGKGSMRAHELQNYIDALAAITARWEEESGNAGSVPGYEADDGVEDPAAHARKQALAAGARHHPRLAKPPPRGASSRVPPPQI